MLVTLITITAYISILTGLAVLLFGDWRKFTLKFLAVTLSTGAAIWLVALNMRYGDVWHARTEVDKFLDDKLLYTLLRNIALIIFHISTGSEAIRIKYRDRRIHG